MVNTPLITVTVLSGLYLPSALEWWRIQGSDCSILLLYCRNRITQIVRSCCILCLFVHRVAGNCAKNLMTVANLGVCFGPTLMRPEEETMKAIMEIKFSNIIIEILISNYHKVSLTCPLFPRWNRRYLLYLCLLLQYFVKLFTVFS